MALGAPINAGSASETKQLVVASSLKGVWKTAVTDAQATAATATELMSPLSFAGSNSRWMRLSESTSRVLVRARGEWTAVTTSPVIRVYGAFTESTPANQFTDDGTTEIMRLDQATSTVAGATLTLTASANGCLKSGNVRWSETLAFVTGPTLAVGDCLGASWLLILVETAANVSGGNDTVTIDVLQL